MNRLIIRQAPSRSSPCPVKPPEVTIPDSVGRKLYLASKIQDLLTWEKRSNTGRGTDKLTDTVRHYRTGSSENPLAIS